MLYFCLLSLSDHVTLTEHLREHFTQPLQGDTFFYRHLFIVWGFISLGHIYLVIGNFNTVSRYLEFCLYDCSARKYSSAKLHQYYLLWTMIGSPKQCLPFSVFIHRNHFSIESPVKVAFFVVIFHSYLLDRIYLTWEVHIVIQFGSVVLLALTLTLPQW